MACMVCEMADTEKHSEKHPRAFLVTAALDLCCAVAREQKHPVTLCVKTLYACNICIIVCSAAIYYHAVDGKYETFNPSL